MPAKGTTKREPWNPLLKSYPFSEKINALSLGAETLFTRLIAQADDYGNYYADPKMLLATLFPHRWSNGEINVTETARWRNELVTCTFGPLAATYSVNGTEYLHLINSRRRFRKDISPDERFPREPADLEEQVLSEYVTSTYRKRTVNVPLDLDPDKTETRQDRDQENHLVGKTENKPLEKVLKRLNELRESNWEWASYRPLTSEKKKNTEHITALLNSGSTVDELIVVLEWKAANDKGNEVARRYFDCVTPFRPKHWENNIALATDWDAKGRPGAQQSGNGKKGSVSTNAIHWDDDDEVAAKLQQRMAGGAK